MNRCLYILSVVFISIGALSCSDDKGAQVTPTEATPATEEAAATEAAPAEAAPEK